VVEANDQCITLEIFPPRDSSWLFTALYASPQEAERRICWQKLSSVAANTNQPWLIAGDFNKTRSMAERLNCGDDLIRCCDSFNRWIENNSFIDLGYSGPPFT